MTSSPERLRLPARPRAVRVSAQGYEAFLDARVAEVAAAAERRGMRAGRAEALAELGALVDSAVEQTHAAGERAAAALAARTAECVVTVAAHVLKREIDAGRYDIERMVRDTLATAATGHAPCVVRVHPSDADRLAAVPFRARTEVRADPELSPGSVQVDTAQGAVVRDVHVVMRQLRFALEALAE
jgi:flagellar biosynthesis/type III secretory pathway protein FliH